MIVATGGLPNTRCARARQRSRRVELGHPVRRRQARRSEVLLYDDNGAHPGLQAAEAAGGGRRAARDRHARALFRARDRRPQPRRLRRAAFSRHGVRITINARLRRGAARGQPPGRQSSAAITDRSSSRRAWSTRSWSSTAPCRSTTSTSRSSRARVNRGEVDYPALIAGRPQTVVSNPDGRFRLFRDRRCRREPQHPRRDLRFLATLQHVVASGSACGQTSRR